MDRLLFSAGGLPVTLAHALFAAVALLLLLLTIATVALIRGSRARTRVAEEALKRQREFDERMGELARNGSELAGRVQAFAEALGSRQADLARLVSASGSMRSGRASARGWRARRARPAITSPN